ncbi:hypothetical protein ABZ734_20895 [Streptomyces sp. NPDC006660]|uniref:hypothetical protein n=1 Tax=Streptomyces sp. NPDC006660 TaxID=3156901 RepID=UPI0033F2A70D
MNEHERAAAEPVPAVTPEPAEPDGALTSEAPALARRNGRVVPLVSGAVALLLVAGGAVWGLAKLGEADRNAPTVVQAMPKGTPAPAPRASVSASAGLGDKLLPLPFNYELGPDIGEFGNDTVLDTQRSIALLKEGGRHLPADMRAESDEIIDNLKIKAIAMRSYGEGHFVVEMRLSQMQNMEAVKDMIEVQKETGRDSKALRVGPEIKGHANSVCLLLPERDGMKLDAMYCTAYEGDIMVNAYTYGPAPLDTADAATLLRRQLDLIASPGEPV